MTVSSSRTSSKLISYTAPITAALMSMLTAGSASAQDAAGPTVALEEVVVTAQKREESLQDVPLSIAALGSEELTRRGITGIGSLTGGQIPSVRVEPFAGNPTILEIAIRGFINVNGVEVPNENPVPIYI